MNLPPLGDGGLCLPYESNPELAHVEEPMIVAGGVVVLGAITKVDGHTYPALMFRFALAGGGLAPPVLLVCMPDELRALEGVVGKAAADAIRAAGARQ